MKKKFLLLIMLMCIMGGVNLSQVNAQEEIMIGEIISDKNGYAVPFEPYKAYSYSQSIYLNSEIGKDITIDKIAYHVASMDNSSIERKLEVYITEISENNFTKQSNNKSYTIPINVQPVFNANVTVAAGWFEINITDYDYKFESGKNLLITINDITGQSGDNNMKFSYYTSSYTTDNTNYYQRTIYQNGNSKYSVNSNSIAIGSKNINPIIKLIPKSAVVNEVGNLNGTIINGDTPVSGATVKLTDANSATTDENGSFSFENIPVGTYDLTVQATGFENYVVKGVVIENGQTTYTTIYMPTILDIDGQWTPTNGVLTENNEVIVRADVTMPQQAITVNTLTIEEGKSLTISNGATLTVKGKIHNIAGNLVIEDGGQIFQSNEGVKATFKMGIINPKDSEGNLEWSNDNTNGWQLISSPFTNAPISSFVTTGEGNDYDLYRFDGKSVNTEWQNQKAIATFEENFVQGIGYLASYQSQEVASITGTLNTRTIMNIATSDANDAVNVRIGYNYNNNLNDFYLIGNPFPFDMDMNKFAGMTWNVIEGYAVVNDGGYSYSDFTGTVKAGDGFFIKTMGTSPSAYYNHNSSSKSRSEKAASINFIATGKNGSDNVIVSFSGAEKEGFNKLENFNKDIATVFVVKDDTRYGIANFDSFVNEFDLAFEATQMGNYTIAAQPNGKFKTLTLVDRFTGVETNLLVEDYNFTATSGDNHNRFIVKLEANSQQPTANGNFAYVSGEDLILSVEGSVQIIDMMGRVVYSNNVESTNNRVNVSDFNNGAYIVRVINENGVKVQKVIL